MDLSKASIGIEFGSTRIKTLLITREGEVLSKASYEWENEFLDGYWTYSLEAIKAGLQGVFASLKEDFRSKYGFPLTHVGSLGISAMMHGYMVFDKEDHLLVPFRTWRNVSAQKAADILTDLFSYHIPARWSIAHLYQAILDKEPHVKDIAFQTTLEGYIHYLLTGRKVIGIGEASGMFPIDPLTKDYDQSCLASFDGLLKENGLPYSLRDIFPKPLLAGEKAGILTKEGALLLDPSGEFLSGVKLCPPEGDAETGMIATNSIKKNTGNVSSGTSIFASIVLDKKLKKAYPEIDLVTTPLGEMVAMVHANNCTSEINAYMGIFSELLSAFGKEVSQEELFTTLFKKSLEGEEDASKIISFNYLSGESITHVDVGHPLMVRNAESLFNLSNLMRSEIYSSFATLKLGFEILEKEGIKIKEIAGHGGLFKTPGVAELYLASALDTPLSIQENAGEGGAYGIAVLASFMNEDMGLEDYLDKVIFKGAKARVALPEAKVKEGFDVYMEQYKKVLKAEQLLSKEL